MCFGIPKLVFYDTFSSYKWKNEDGENNVFFILIQFRIIGLLVLKKLVLSYMSHARIAKTTALLSTPEQQGP